MAHARKLLYAPSANAHSDSRTRYTEVAGSPPARAAAPRRTCTHTHVTPHHTHDHAPTTPDLNAGSGTAARLFNIVFTPQTPKPCTY